MDWWHVKKFYPDRQPKIHSKTLFNFHYRDHNFKINRFVLLLFSGKYTG